MRNFAKLFDIKTFMNNKEYLVVGRSNGTTKTGSHYASLKVANLNETINVSVWDMTPTAEPQVGQLVFFYNIKDNAGKKSCDFRDLKCGGEPLFDHELYNLLPRPIRRDVWDDTIRKLLGYCSDKALMAVIEEFAGRFYEPFSTYPAATSMHHAFPGGLLNHTHQMLRILEGLYPCLPYRVKVEHCILAILFHDCGKMNEYNKTGETQTDMYLLGHIYIGAHWLHNILKEKGICDDETKRIVHCVLSHHGTKEFGSPVVPCTQEAIVVTHIDNLSAKTDMWEGAGNMEYMNALGTKKVAPSNSLQGENI